MSFFIRRGGKNDLTKKASGKKKMTNTEMKRRPQKRPQAQDSDRKSGNRKQHKRLNSQQYNHAKKPRFDPNEEIESSSDNEGEEEEHKNVQRFATLEELETPQDKKLRLAKLYLEEIEKEETERRENEDIDTHLLVSNRLQQDILEQEGRLKKEVAEKVSLDLNNIIVLSCAKFKSVTCLCISPDNLWIFSGCKDGNLIKWSVSEKKKVGIVKKKETLSKRKKKKGIVLKPDANDPNSAHSSTITTLAISSDGKFLASGDLENQIVIWDPNTLKRIHIFKGHRGAIRSLVFRKKTHTLYSCSNDRSLRIWSLDEMGYVETLFGHQDAVTCVDALTRERAISSGGRDNSIRVWKIVEESQLVYNGHYNGSVDLVKLVNEENFVSCGDDGNLCSWNVNRKKPLFTERNAHGVQEATGNPNWISALAAWNNTDVVASGSCDNLIRLWKCGERFKSLTPIVQIPCDGWINALEFSHGSEIDGKFLIAGVGKENRLGRWFENFKNAKNSIVIITLSRPSVKIVKNNNVPLVNGTNGLLSSSESDESDNDDINMSNKSSVVDDDTGKSDNDNDDKNVSNTINVDDTDESDDDDIIISNKNNVVDEDAGKRDNDNGNDDRKVSNINNVDDTDESDNDNDRNVNNNSGAESDNDDRSDIINNNIIYDTDEGSNNDNDGDDGIASNDDDSGDIDSDDSNIEIVDLEEI